MITFDSLQALSGVRIYYPSGSLQDFASLSIDSRRIEPGALFCALRGVNFDGHAFVGDALKKGAGGAIIAEAEFEWQRENLVHALPGRSDWRLFRVPDTLLALQELARIHRRRHRAAIIGITGTNGKTSTKDMLSLVLSQKYTVLKTPGNYNNQIGLPLTLLSLNESHDAAVIEMGANHPGEIRELSQIAEPVIGIITNAGKGHLEYFGSVEEVVRTKMGLIESLLPPADGYINGDNEYLRACVGERRNITTFGFNEKNAVRGEIQSLSGEGNALLKINGDGPIRLSVPGRGQAYNALAVYGVAKSFGLSFESIKTGIESFTGNSNRGTWLLWNGIRIYNDSYNANPDSLMNAFSIFGDMVPSGNGRKFALLGDMLELGKHSETEHRRMGKAARDSGFDCVYTFGTHAQFLAEEAGRSGVPEAIHFKDKAEIVAQVKKKPKKTTSF